MGSLLSADASCLALPIPSLIMKMEQVDKPKHDENEYKMQQITV